LVLAVLSSAAASPWRLDGVVMARSGNEDQARLLVSMCWDARHLDAAARSSLITGLTSSPVQHESRR